MGRPKKANPAELSVSVRLTVEDGEKLASIVAWRTHELADQGADVSAAGVLRWLIRRAAEEVPKEHRGRKSPPAASSTTKAAKPRGRA